MTPPTPRPARRLPGLAVLALASVAVACGGGGGTAGGETGGPPEPEGPPEWRADMPVEELRAVADELALDVPAAASKKELIEALEDATGCGCFGATCGEGACGHACGGCADAGAACFGGGCETAASCPVKAVVAGAQAATLKDDTVEARLRYEAETPGGPFERVRIISFRPSADPLAPGTWPLRREDPFACELCVVAYAGCSETECAQVFVSRSGTVTVDRVDTRLVATLDEMKFVPAYEDTFYNIYTPLPSAGAPVCVTSFTVDAPLERIEARPSDCVAQGDGNKLGKHIGDYTLQNCDGEEVHLHDACGLKAVWLVGAAGWCTSCTAYLNEHSSLVPQYVDQGVELLVHLEEDANYDPPTLEYCHQFAKKHAIDPKRVLVDPGFETLFGRIDSGSGGSISLPWVGVLDAGAMTYEWNNVSGEGSAVGVIEEILSAE